MRKRIAILLLAALLLSLCGCGRTEERAVQAAADGTDGALRVVATMFPAFDFARVICGGRCTITLLVPPGAEAHSFEPTAQDLIRIESCDLLICNGGESESWLESLLEGAEGDFARVVMLDCVEALEEEEKEGMQLAHGHEEHDGHEEHETEYDEHVWTSPRNAARICRAICELLCALDPEGETLYRGNCERYCAELDRLDAAFREIAASGRLHCLIFADRFPVRYFVEEYGLDYYAAFPGCADETEPSARTVAFLIDRVRETGTPTVLYIEYSNQKMADVICEDTGCGKARFHSCHTLSAADFKSGASYLSLMWENTESIKEALG